MTFVRFIFLLSLVGLGTGCPPATDEGSYCNRDTDCDFQCSRLSQCLQEGNVIDVRTRWTIAGIAPSPADPSGCGPIVNFEFHLESDDRLGDAVTFFPIPCRLGQVFYDRMPGHLINLRLTAVDEIGTVLGVGYRRIETASSDFTIDF